MSEQVVVQHDTPVWVTPHNLLPVSNYPAQMAEIPPSRMFLINKGLSAYRESHPGSATYDASQGDGGASLPGVPKDVLQRAAELQAERGTSYDMPYGHDSFRRAVIEQYWQLDASTGLGPANVLATVGGRDALVKAYGAMIKLGHGRAGDVIAVSRVPWISYNWGPYGVGANVVLAPGRPEHGWAYTVEAIRELVDFVEAHDRRVAGLVITNPDNPTGNTISVSAQVELARAALEAGVAFVLFDWMYHRVTDDEPMDLNTFVAHFSPAERERLMWLDGITKSLGASNIRNAHLIASERVIRHIQAQASHSVIPSFHSQAVAMAAFEQGFATAAATIIEPTNNSRNVLRDALRERGFTHILGQGYYAFIDVGGYIRAAGMADSAQLGEHLAKQWGIAVVPGAYFSSFGADWIRFSYATPPDYTLAAFERLVAGLDSLTR